MNLVLFIYLKNKQFITWNMVTDYGSYNIITYIKTSKNKTKRKKKRKEREKQKKAKNRSKIDYSTK